MREFKNQMSLFDGAEKFKIDKPIRLIELFGGVGCQLMSLKRLAAEGLCQVESYRYCEIDKYACKSFNAIHGTNYEPSDITKWTGKDLGIVDKDKYCYIVTYSFPCTDLSLAGKREGMAKGSGTRSGLLWEVERLLKECDELPQVLLMENVPQVICDDFFEWTRFLDSLGYKSEYSLLNSRDYGVPQNRNRFFMVSMLGDYYYTFPEPFPLEKRLKDVLEDKVDEKYYLNDKAIRFVMKRVGGYTQLCDEQTEDAHCPLTSKGNANWTGNFVKEVGNAIRGGGESLIRPTQLGYSCGGIFSNKGTELENATDVATTLMARDYKGFGNQNMTGVIEVNDEKNI